MRSRIRKAFTLVEILIVVVILGILAAIVVPQFTNATQDAQAGNIQSQLETLQNQLELYRARNSSTYPDLAANQWQELIDGEYIKAAPENPFNGSSVVDEGGGDPAAIGWHWDPVSGNLGAYNYAETGPDRGRITPGVE